MLNDIERILISEEQIKEGVARLGKQIAEEYADVMMYGLQLMSALGVDVTEQILRKIDIVDHRPARRDNPKR